MTRPSPTRHSLIARIVLAALATLATAAGGAAADDDAKAKIVSTLRGYAARVEDAKARGDIQYVKDDVADCRAAIAAGPAAGYKPSDTIDTGYAVLVWSKAGKVCDAYAQLVPLHRISVAAGDTLVASETTDPDYLRALAPEGKACVEAIDKELAAGLSPDVKFRPTTNGGDWTLTVAEARARCADMAGRARDSIAAVDAQRAAAAAALKAKYVKLGVKGDRLKYLMDTDTLILLGKRCSELDLKARKGSPVFYQVNEDDALWYVWKTTFKKDKLVRTDVRKYNKATQTWRCW
ncbi:MAG: hypothetical protein IPL61_29920 [Myxococcales bacterium]|nr:hypothetical protein [Myxococcales bacterium]